MSEKRDVLPCGHTRAQGAWLGCDEDGHCRTSDERISMQYRTEEQDEPPARRRA